MKHVSITSAFCIVIAFSLSARAQDLDRIAETMVTGSLEVMPGEIILITGGPTEIDLLGALQVAVRKAGGEPVLLLNIPDANLRATMETPIEHLSRTPVSNLLLTRMADAFVNVGSVQDPDLFADVPEERLTAARKAASVLNDALARATYRSVSLGQTGAIPTPAYAASVNADYDALTDMFWRAVGVDSETLAKHATAVADVLAPSAAVRLTSASGTDLRFTIGGEARINAGRTADVVKASGPASVWLPAGEAYAPVDLRSASGTMVVPHWTFRGLPVQNLSVTFSGGAITDLTADDHADKIQAFLDASDDAAKHLSLLDIGVNPQSKPIEGSHYASWEMGGIVTVGIGNNSWAGGDNNSDGALIFHLHNATLEVDGDVLVERGELIR